MNESDGRQFEAISQLDDAYDDAPVGYIAVDPTGCIVKANRAFLELTGYAEDEVVDRLRFSDVLTLGGRIWAETHFHPALMMHGHLYEAAFDVVRKDGRAVATLVNAVQRRDADGRHLFNRITMFPATERRRYEQELLLARREAEQAVEELTRTTSELGRVNDALIQANRELAQFTHVASHDLQAPLRVVTNYVELLALRLAGTLDTKTSGYLHRIRDMTMRMQSLVRDLLELSRASVPVRAEVDLAEVVADVLQLLAADIESTGGEVSMGPLPRVSVDRRQVAQLFQNLIGNALRYRHPERPPRIRIEAVDSGSEQVITVRDNGLGFDMRFAERIFAPFERLHGDDIPGTGIGLALCRKVVEAHGGRVWAESSPGEGSCFSIVLPEQSTRP